MMINSINTATQMGTPHDKNAAARNVDVDLDAIDAGWELPKLPEPSAQEKKGAKEFIYVKPEDIQDEVHRDAMRAFEPEPEVIVEAEDTLKMGLDGLTNVLTREGFEVPENLIINGGENSFRDLSFTIRGGKIDKVDPQSNKDYNVYAVTDNGEKSSNHDGIAVNYDEKHRLSVFLAHGPQYDPLCANRTNAAAIKAGVEMATNPYINPVGLVKRAKANVEKVEDEYVERHKDMDITALQLDPTSRHDMSKLRVNNLGNNHIIVLSPDTGKVMKMPKSDSLLETAVMEKEIVIVATDELLKLFEGSREDAEIQLGNMMFTNLGEGRNLKEACDDIIEFARGMGLGSSIGMIAIQVPRGVTVEDVIGPTK